MKFQKRVNTNLNALRNTVHSPQFWYISEGSDGPNDLNGCED